MLWIPGKVLLTVRGKEKKKAETVAGEAAENLPFEPQAPSRGSLRGMLQDSETTNTIPTDIFTLTRPHLQSLCK